MITNLNKIAKFMIFSFVVSDKSRGIFAHRK